MQNMIHACIGWLSAITPPQHSNCSSNTHQKVSMLDESVLWKILGEDISWLYRRVDVLEIESLVFDLISYPVIDDVDVLVLLRNPARIGNGNG